MKKLGKSSSKSETTTSSSSNKEDSLMSYDPETLYQAGYCFYYGNGVPVDKSKAIKCWKLAAERGHVRAQCDLGASYYMGDGVPANRDEARKWWRKAAAQGDEKAIEFLNDL